MGRMQTQRNLLPDIRDMLLLSMTPTGVSDWMTTQHEALGMTPLQALTDGHYIPVYELVLNLPNQT